MTEDLGNMDRSIAIGLMWVVIITFCILLGFACRHAGESHTQWVKECKRKGGEVVYQYRNQDLCLKKGSVL